ncbi:SPASM domain-containing protein [Moorella sulfitireducens]|uniref:SPASM domain-containing protein n=1 Tax=Neomoorella sulfitireducens TaxID=2972948 RepID=UPI003BF61CE8
MLAQKDQESEIERAISFFNQFLGPNDCIYTRSIKSLAGQVRVAIMTEDSWLGLEKFKEDLSKRIDTSKFVVENWCKLLKLKGPIEKRKACRHPYKYCMILWDGTVVGCCIDFNGHLNMGNLNNESLYEIWTGERYNRFRRAMEKLDFRKYRLCESCEEWYKCI